MTNLKWLYPGMQVKRWIALLTVGITFLSLGVAYLLVDAYREQPFPEYAAYLTLQFVDRPLRGLMFIVLGLAVAGLALSRMSHSMLSALLPAGRDENIVDIIYQRRQLRRGPRIVAIGGGTGLSTLLRGIKAYSGNITAIVTVGDDGGSSGRLRKEYGVLPPGDFRQCIVALAEAEPLMTRLFQYRFGKGSDLEGHSFGNLFITAMTGITGNFEKALRESSRVLAVSGQILPSTLADVTLCAEFEGQTVDGESAIPKAGLPIKRLFIKPDDVPAHPEALRAILQADMIIAGPGSLFTSVLPNLLVPDVVQAIKASGALRVYVCNNCTQRGETDGFSVEEHLKVLAEHVGGNVFDYVLANDNYTPAPSLPGSVQMVRLSDGSYDHRGCEIVCGDWVDVSQPWRHDPAKLSQGLIRLYHERGPAHNGKKTVLSRTVSDVRSAFM
jgi:uncharacterized cofD-like protein